MPTLQFKGKNIIWNHHLSVPYHSLEKVEELDFQPEMGEDNFIVEGDNLIALKALLPEYSGKIKFIYIDPPYNTGKENWIYNDKVNSPMINEWFKKNVGKDDLTRHDKWLCMIVPRLKLLRDLLADDGVIFISIDDNEYGNLKAVMDEIFLEDNFIENYIWESTFRPDNSSPLERENAQYVLCYSKNKSLLKRLYGNVAGSDGLPSLTKNSMKAGILEFPKESVEFLISDGRYEAGQKKDNYVLLDDVTVEGGTNKSKFRLQGKMIWGQKYLEDQLAQDTKIIIKTEGFVPYSRKKEDSNLAPNTIIPKDIVSDVLSGRAEIKNLFGDNPFEHPKPTSLIKYLLTTIGNTNCIVLDSFAGSGTTMNAVNDLNKIDGGNRKCILVQMTEATEEEPDKNICRDITRERNKLAIEKFGYESGFRYLKVGAAIDPETMLDGELPTYNQFAEYVFYLATGGHLADKENINSENHFVGTEGSQAIYLIYEQDFDKLTRMALTLDIAEQIIAHSPGKRRTVFAPSCFLDEDYMTEKQIEFVSVPYNLFERNTAD